MIFIEGLYFPGEPIPGLHTFYLHGIFQSNLNDLIMGSLVGFLEISNPLGLAATGRGLNSYEMLPCPLLVLLFRYKPFLYPLILDDFLH